MSGLQYYTYPKWGEKAAKDFNYSQAVRIGTRIECAGQGKHSAPPPPPPEKIALLGGFLLSFCPRRRMGP